MEVLEKHGTRGTAALNSEVCDDYPEIVEDARALEARKQRSWRSRLHLPSPCLHPRRHPQAPSDPGKPFSRRGRL